MGIQGGGNCCLDTVHNRSVFTVLGRSTENLILLVATKKFSMNDPSCEHSILVSHPLIH